MERKVRTSTRRRMNEGGKNKISEESFMRDAKRNNRGPNHLDGKVVDKKILQDPSNLI